jgi:hypothetical protein
LRFFKFPLGVPTVLIEKKDSGQRTACSGQAVVSGSCRRNLKIKVQNAKLWSRFAEIITEGGVN